MLTINSILLIMRVKTIMVDILTMVIRIKM